jgi:hypothetical protein
VLCLVELLKNVGFRDPSPWCFSQNCGFSGSMLLILIVSPLTSFDLTEVKFHRFPDFLVLRSKKISDDGRNWLCHVIESRNWNVFGRCGCHSCAISSIELPCCCWKWQVWNSVSYAWWTVLFVLNSSDVLQIFLCCPNQKSVRNSFLVSAVSNSPE